MDPKKGDRKLSRRDFGLLSASALAAPLVACGPGQQTSTTEPAGAPASGGTPNSGSQVVRRRAGNPSQGLNIVFVFGDQERFFSKWPTGLSLPGRERLQKEGVAFQNHYTSAIMCTPHARCS